MLGTKDAEDNYGDTLMLVNGLPLPNAFIQLSHAIERGGTHLFLLKEEVDAYGNPFGGGFALYLWTADQASQGDRECLTDYYGTDRLSPEEIEALDNDADDPGRIPYISDFSKIVWLGQNIGNDDPFCFDFRESPEEPSIICYESWYWRRVAPSFESFIGLYKPSRFVSASAEERYGHRPELALTRRAVAISEEALARIRVGRELDEAEQQYWLQVRMMASTEDLNGYVQRLTELSQEELALAFKTMREAVLNNDELTPMQRDHKAERLAKLGLQAVSTLAKPVRFQPDAAKSAWSELAQGMGETGPLAEAWRVWGAKIGALFGF